MARIRTGRIFIKLYLLPFLLLVMLFFNLILLVHLEFLDVGSLYLNFVPGALIHGLIQLDFRNRLLKTQGICGLDY